MTSDWSPELIRQIGELECAKMKHDRTEELRKIAFELSHREQYRLAYFLAENLGYVLAREQQIHALESALQECAKPWVSPPGLMMDCANAMGEEFQRRLDMAANALKQSAPLETAPHNTGEREPSSDAAPGGADTYTSGRVFDGRRELSPDRVARLRENYSRTHSDHGTSSLFETGEP